MELRLFWAIAAAAARAAERWVQGKEVWAQVLQRVVVMAARVVVARGEEGRLCACDRMVGA